MITTYEWKRDELIKKAAFVADLNWKKEQKPGDTKAAAWNRVYHAEMNRLAKEKKI